MDPSTSSHALELQNLNSVSSWNQEDVTCMPPKIYMAAAQGYTNIIRRRMPRAVQYLTPNKNTILHIAAQFGQPKCIAWIIRHYSEDSSLLQWPNLKEDSPSTLGHLEVVKPFVFNLVTKSEAINSEVHKLSKVNFPIDKRFFVKLRWLCCFDFHEDHKKFLCYIKGRLDYVCL